MSRKSRKHLAGTVQPEFDFGFVVARAAVETLLRFTKSGKFNDKVDLGTWLAFYTPLNGAK